jgi:hypothetical protein
MSEVHVAPHPTCVCVCVFVCVCVRACTNCLGLTNTQGDVCMYLCVCVSGIAPPCRQADAGSDRQHQPSACEIHSEFVRNQAAHIPRKTRPVRFYIQFKYTHMHARMHACTHARMRITMRSDTGCTNAHKYIIRGYIRIQSEPERRRYQDHTYTHALCARALPHMHTSDSQRAAHTQKVRTIIILHNNI